jgi:DNA-binding transcriptional MerR regulator
MRKLLLFLGVCFVYTAQAQETIISYKGQPVPSAIAPSMSAFSQDVCGIPVSGAVSSTVIGFSGGTVYTDANCERIKLAKTLNDLGLKVAAVATLCQDERIWDAMMQSGTPCPIDGLIGDAARNEWVKQHPKKFERLYGKVPNIISVTVQSIESK